MILVTGATGKVGGQVVTQLMTAGAPVRSLTRDPGSARPPYGAEVVRGDLAQPDSLDEALDGIESVFLVWSTPTADHAAPATLERFAKQVGRIVYLSANGTPDEPPQEGARTILESHAMIEHLIRRTGREWTFLRSGGFAGNTLAWAPQIRSGDVVRWVYGAAGRSLIHERDIAAIGVYVLTEDGHAGAK